MTRRLACLILIALTGVVSRAADPVAFGGTDQLGAPHVRMHAALAADCVAHAERYAQMFHAIDPTRVGPRPPRVSS